MLTLKSSRIIKWTRLQLFLPTEDNKITEQKILVTKTDPSEIDALLIDHSMNIEGKELYVLRRINKEDYLAKFYLK